MKRRKHWESVWDSLQFLSTFDEQRTGIIHAYSMTSYVFNEIRITIETIHLRVNCEKWGNEE